MRGGETAPPGREPDGRVLARYVATDCKDAGGGKLADSTRVFLVDEGQGQKFLVDSRPSYDSIVVRNHFDEGQEVVFQVLLETSGGKKILRDYRLPASGQGDGRMAAGESFDLNDVPEPAVRGRLRSSTLACKLSPEVAPEATPDAAPDAAPEPASDAEAPK